MDWLHGRASYQVNAWLGAWHTVAPQECLLNEKQPVCKQERGRPPQFKGHSFWNVMYKLLLSEASSGLLMNSQRLEYSANLSVVATFTCQVTHHTGSWFSWLRRGKKWPNKVCHSASGWTQMGLETAPILLVSSSVGAVFSECKGFCLDYFISPLH